jgi:hypothetical protein
MPRISGCRRPPMRSASGLAGAVELTCPEPVSSNAHGRVIRSPVINWPVETTGERRRKAVGGFGVIGRSIGGATPGLMYSDGRVGIVLPVRLIGPWAGGRSACAQSSDPVLRPLPPIVVHHRFSFRGSVPTSASTRGSQPRSGARRTRCRATSLAGRRRMRGDQTGATENSGDACEQRLSALADRLGRAWQQLDAVIEMSSRRNARLPSSCSRASWRWRSAAQLLRGSSTGGCGCRVGSMPATRAGWTASTPCPDGLTAAMWGKRCRWLPASSQDRVAGADGRRDGPGFAGFGCAVREELLCGC